MPPMRSEGEELKYPFFEGDGSSFDEWRDYDVASDDYEGSLIFDDDQFEEELETQVEELVSKGHVRERMSPWLPYYGDSSDDDLVGNLRTNFVYPWGNDEGPSIE
nr:putative reverse transcriptase domain-containing protein [Tanacetum cinerariifolium]